MEEEIDEAYNYNRDYCENFYDDEKEDEDEKLNDDNVKTFSEISTNNDSTTNNEKDVQKKN